MDWLMWLLLGLSVERERGYDAAEAHLYKLEAAIDVFVLDCGRLPDSIDELLGSVRDVAACPARVFSRREDLRSPGGQQPHYWKSADGKSYRLRLPGRDGVFASADDVTLEHDPHVWGGTLIQQRQQRRLFAGLGLLLALLWLCRRWLRSAKRRPC